MKCYHAVIMGNCVTFYVDTETSLILLYMRWWAIFSCLKNKGQEIGRVVKVNDNCLSLRKSSKQKKIVTQYWKMNSI